MPKIYVEINQAIDFNINIYDTPIGEKFFNQHVEITRQDPVQAIPVITDFTKYTINYFIKLIEEARDTDDVDAALTEWYYANQPDLTMLGYSLEKIIDHTGFCIPGRIDNLSKLEYMRNTPNIQITGYQLIN